MKRKIERNADGGRLDHELLWQVLSMGLIVFLTVQTLDAHAQGKVGGSTSGSAGSGTNVANAVSNRSAVVGSGGAAGKQFSGGDSSVVGTTDWRGGSRETETTRAGLGGGQTSEPVTPAVVVSSPTLSVAQFGKCPAAASMADPRARLAGNSIGRLRTVAHYLRQGAPDDSSSKPTAHYLLADIQEQLEGKRADVTLVGTYFGLASELPVTADLVTAVSRSLCAPVSANTASAIAVIGEAQRVRMLLGR